MKNRFKKRFAPLFGIVILLTVILFSTVTCNNGDINGDINVDYKDNATLVIRNESASDITHVVWNGVFFTVGDALLATGEEISKTVTAGNGHIYFIRKSTHIYAQTNDIIVVAKGEKIEFVFSNNTSIEEVGNPDNKGAFSSLVAEFAESQTINFNINGAIGITPSSMERLLSGSSVTLPNGSRFAKEGFLFDGWSTDPLGIEICYSSGSFYIVEGTKTGEVVLYAIWALEFDARVPPVIKEIASDIHRVIVTSDGVKRELKIRIENRSLPLRIELRNVNAIGQDGSTGALRQVGGEGNSVIGDYFSSVPDLTIVSSGSSNELIAGNGGTGGGGGTAGNRNGGNGGKGGSVIIADKVTIKGNTNITLKSGNGGNGGRGGPSDILQPTQNCNGGNGGNGGVSINANNIIIDTPGRTVFLPLSQGGTKGIKGEAGINIAIVGKDGIDGTSGSQFPTTSSVSILPGTSVEPRP